MRFRRQLSRERRGQQTVRVARLIGHSVLGELYQFSVL